MSTNLTGTIGKIWTQNSKVDFAVGFLAGTSYILNDNLTSYDFPPKSIEEHKKFTRAKKTATFTIPEVNLICRYQSIVSVNALKGAMQDYTLPNITIGQIVEGWMNYIRTSRIKIFS